jgi:hypothetical protein
MKLNNRNKRAQIKMFESIGVLLIFFFIVGFGIQFYGNLQLQELEEAQRNFDEISSIELASKVLNFPQLSCTQNNVRKPTCVDIYKIQTWDDVSGLRSFLVGEFPSANISIKQLYPTEQTIEVYSDQPNKPRSELEVILTNIPITIYNASTKQYNYGLLEVKKFG